MSSSTPLCEHGHTDRLTSCNQCSAREIEGSSSTPEVVEAVALAMAQEIGWGTFSHFDPEDMRRIARAAIAALPPSNMIGEAIEALEPFAGMSFKGSIWEGEFEPDDSIVHCNIADNRTITLGDFRKARATLSKLRGEG